MSTESSSNGGVGFFGLLAIVFITLKLTAVINWPWWWVVSPIWIPITILCFVLAFIEVVCMARELLK